MRIVVTGNMGAGKSTFLAWLRGKLPTAPQVSMDDLVVDLYRDNNFKAWLRSKFGVDDKAQVAEHVTRHPEDFRKLMSHTYTDLFNRLRSSLADAQARSPVVVAEIPLLFESSMGLAKADMIVTLDVPAEVRLQRVLARDNRSESAIRAKMAAQLSDATKRSLADIVIDGTKPFNDQPAAQLLVLAARVTALFGKQTWPLIHAAYSQPHRGYHGISHLVHLFEEFEKVKDQVREPLRFAAALLFHDFVYSTNLAEYGNNESRSAKALLDWARSTAPALLDAGKEGPFSLVAGAAELILATKTHTLSSPFIQAHPDLKADAELFLDLDLSQLSRDRVEDALADQEGIWYEFSAGVTRSLFCQKRIEVLEAFKTRSVLYFTDHYAARHALAIRNLSAMQDELRKTAEDPPPLAYINNQGS